MTVVPRALLLKMFSLIQCIYTFSDEGSYTCIEGLNDTQGLYSSVSVFLMDVIIATVMFIIKHNEVHKVHQMNVNLQGATIYPCFMRWTSLPNI